MALTVYSVRRKFSRALELKTLIKWTALKSIPKETGGGGGEGEGGEFAAVPHDTKTSNCLYDLYVQ